MNLAFRPVQQIGHKVYIEKDVMNKWDDSQNESKIVRQGCQTFSCFPWLLPVLWVKYHIPTNETYEDNQWGLC